MKKICADGHHHHGKKRSTAGLAAGGPGLRPVHRRVACATVAALCFAAAPAFSQPAPLPLREVPIGLDSGVHANHGTQPQVVWSEIVAVPETLWLRLYFEEVTLGFDPETQTGSVIRLTSLEDGHQQHLDFISAAEWQNTSAYFNGNAVQVELIAHPGGRPNRIIVERVDAGEMDGEWPSSICDNIDLRELSDDPRTGRMLNGGCTGWLIDDVHHTFISAGHCAGTSSVMQFNVPLSNSNGSINHPPPRDQYSIDPTSLQRQASGVGQDWAYFGTFRNSETRLTAYQTQQAHWVLASTPPPAQGQGIRITGYGTTSSPVPPQWNRAQKTHVGPYTSFTGTSLRYRADTTGGNSGSPVIYENTGLAIGVHSHGGCSGSSGSNAGTGINHTGWQNALANPRGICRPFDLIVPDLNAGQNAIFETRGATAGHTVYFAYSRVGLGSFHSIEAGVTLGLDRPIIGGTAVADAQGIALLGARIPPGARGMTLHFQAVESGRLSFVVLKRVN